MERFKVVQLEDLPLRRGLPCSKEISIRVNFSQINPTSLSQIISIGFILIFFCNVEMQESISLSAHPLKVSKNFPPLTFMLVLMSSSF
jgi:hypothetical protein